MWRVVFWGILVCWDFAHTFHLDFYTEELWLLFEYFLMVIRLNFYVSPCKTVLLCLSLKFMKLPIFLMSHVIVFFFFFNLYNLGIAIFMLYSTEFCFYFLSSYFLFLWAYSVVIFPHVSYWIHSLFLKFILHCVFKAINLSLSSILVKPHKFWEVMPSLVLLSMNNFSFYKNAASFQFLEKKDFLKNFVTFMLLFIF